MPCSVSAVISTLNPIKGRFETSLAQNTPIRKGSPHNVVIIFSCYSVSALILPYNMQKNGEKKTASLVGHPFWVPGDTETWLGLGSQNANFSLGDLKF